MANALLECLKRKPHGRPAVWLDAEDFGSEVLLSGKSFPWTQLTEFISAYGKLQSLLKFDVAPVDIGRCIAAWMQSNPGALYEMGGKQRIRYAIKKLLGLEGHRHLAREIVSALGKTLSQSLVIVIPENGELIRWAHRAANGVEVDEITGIDIDSVSVYLADYLRAFSGLEVRGVMIQLPAGASVNDELLELYSPIINVARHYQWAFGIQVKDPAEISPKEYSIDFAISDMCAVSPCGLVLGDGFWQDGAVTEADFYFSRVPENLRPEQVLQRLERL